MKKTKLVMIIVFGLLFIVGTSIVAILVLSKCGEGNKEILGVFKEDDKGVIEIFEENNKENVVIQEELKIDYLTIDDSYTSEELKQMYESKELVEGTIYKAKCDMNNDDIIDIVEVIVKNEVKYVPERSDAYGIQGYDGGIDNCIVKINNIEKNLKAINPIKEIEIVNENGTKKLKIYTSYRDYARNYYITYSNELNVETEEMGNTISVGNALFEYTTRGSESIITRIVGNEKITSNADMFEYEYDKLILIIPEKIGDYEVVGIKKGAFDKCKSEYVIIPDNVSGIESGVIPSRIKCISQDDESIVKVDKEDILSQYPKNGYEDYSNMCLELKNTFFTCSGFEMKSNIIYQVDMNGDGIYEYIYVKENNLYINDKICNDYYTKFDKYYITDLDRNDSKLEVIREIPTDSGSYEFFGYDGTVKYIGRFDVAIMDGYGNVINFDDKVFGIDYILIGYYKLINNSLEKQDIEYNENIEYTASNKLIFSENYEDIKQCLEWINHREKTDAVETYRKNSKVLEEGDSFKVIDVYDDKSAWYAIPFVRLKDGTEGYIMDYNALEDVMRYK